MFTRLRARDGPLLVAERIDDVAPGHGDAERAQRVLDANGAGVRGQDLRQALVRLGRLVGAAADEHDALLPQPGLHRRPVDLARAQLLLDPHLLHARVRVVGADPLLRRAQTRADAVDVEHAVAVAVPARPALAPPDAPRRLGAAHRAPRAVHR